MGMITQPANAVGSAGAIERVGLWSVWIFARCRPPVAPASVSAKKLNLFVVRSLGRAVDAPAILSALVMTAAHSLKLTPF